MPFVDRHGQAPVECGLANERLLCRQEHGAVFEQRRTETRLRRTKQEITEVVCGDLEQFRRNRASQAVLSQPQGLELTELR